MVHTGRLQPAVIEYIGSKPIPAARSINPASGELIVQYRYLTSADIEPDLAKAALLNASHDLALGVLDDPCIATATLTGSGRAGEAIASKAVSVFEKSLLELDGADPFFVLADADLNRAAKAAVTSRYQNAG